MNSCYWTKGCKSHQVSYEANAALKPVANNTTFKCSGEECFHTQGLMVFSDLLINSTHFNIFFRESERICTFETIKTLATSLDSLSIPFQF